MEKVPGSDGSHLIRGGMKAAALWFGSLYLLKANFTNIPGWRKRIQLKIT